MKQHKGLKTEVVKSNGYLLVVSEANVLIGMQRAVVKAECVSDIKPTDTPAIRILRTYSYPDLVAPVVKVEGFDNWPITFEEFLDLPDALAGLWEEVVYRLNPHWNPNQPTSSESDPVKKES